MGYWISFQRPTDNVGTVGAVLLWNAGLGEAAELEQYIVAESPMKGYSSERALARLVCIGIIISFEAVYSGHDWRYLHGNTFLSKIYFELIVIDWNYLKNMI